MHCKITYYILHIFIHLTWEPTYVLYLSIQILADRVGIPCKLVKGSNYTSGDDDDAINIIKMDNERNQYVLSVYSLHSIVTYF
jgi:hypothetical protein